jgi:hypothetical protein
MFKTPFITPGVPLIVIVSDVNAVVDVKPTNPIVGAEIDVRVKLSPDDRVKVTVSPGKQVAPTHRSVSKSNAIAVTGPGRAIENPSSPVVDCWELRTWLGVP